MFIMRRLLCAVLIAESWSKLYRQMRDFLVEWIQPATSWFGRQWQVGLRRTSVTSLDWRQYRSRKHWRENRWLSLSWGPCHRNVPPGGVSRIRDFKQNMRSNRRDLITDLLQWTDTDWTEGRHTPPETRRDVFIRRCQYQHTEPRSKILRIRYIHRWFHHIWADLYNLHAFVARELCLGTIYAFDAVENGRTTWLRASIYVDRSVKGNFDAKPWWPHNTPVD